MSINSCDLLSHFFPLLLFILTLKHFLLYFEPSRDKRSRMRERQKEANEAVFVLLRIIVKRNEN